MLDFYRTHAGRRFFDATLPALIRAVDRLAAALEAAGAPTIVPHSPMEEALRNGSYRMEQVGSEASALVTARGAVARAVAAMEARESGGVRRDSAAELHSEALRTARAAAEYIDASLEALGCEDVPGSNDRPPSGVAGG